MEKNFEIVSELYNKNIKPELLKKYPESIVNKVYVHSSTIMLFEIANESYYKDICLDIYKELEKYKCYFPYIEQKMISLDKFIEQLEELLQKKS